MKAKKKYIDIFRKKKYKYFNDETLGKSLKNGDHELVKNTIIHDDLRDSLKLMQFIILAVPMPII